MHNITYQLYTFLSLVLYGLWGFFGAKTSTFLSPRLAVFFSGIGSAVIGFLCFPLTHLKIQSSFQGATFGIITGASTALGTIFFIAALQKGPQIPVVMMTALYPMITILLLFLFDNDHLSMHQIIGIILSIIALILLNLP